VKKGSNPSQDVGRYTRARVAHLDDNLRSLKTTIEVAHRRHRAELLLQREYEELAQQKCELEQRSIELTELAQRLREESTVDALTGLHNRRYFDVVLRRELSLAAREGLPVSLILLDLDHFKEINDTFGHGGGDAVLRELAEVLRFWLRRYDVGCRYGGDEIAIVDLDTSLSEACALAERLRAGIEGLLVVDDRGRPVTPITASFGISTFPYHGRQPEQLVHAADRALYGAKAEGRNRVAAAPPRTLPPET
jgi:diguanylate cyclase (GGDEF)-like protein